MHVRQAGRNVHKETDRKETWCRVVGVPDRVPEVLHREFVHIGLEAIMDKSEIIRLGVGVQVELMPRPVDVQQESGVLRDVLLVTQHEVVFAIHTSEGYGFVHFLVVRCSREVEFLEAPQALLPAPGGVEEDQHRFLVLLDARLEVRGLQMVHYRIGSIQ
jgi:hypothetical protein